MSLAGGRSAKGRSRRLLFHIVAGAVFTVLIAVLRANAAEIDSASLRRDWDEARIPGPEHIDPNTAAHLIAFAEIGRDRCGFSSFPVWSLDKRYNLQRRDFKMAIGSIGEQSGEDSIGPYFQIMVEAEDDAIKMFGLRGTAEGCLVVREEIAKHVKLDD